MTTATSLPREQRLAWEDGYSCGKQNDRAMRGLMRLGISCAANRITELNCRSWLDGFEQGQMDAGHCDENQQGEST